VKNTLYDVSKLAEVSTATVSRVVNGTGPVSDDTRRKVMKAIAGLQYSPSHAARALARNATDCIGAIFPDIDSGFFTEVLRGINDETAEHGYHLMTAFAHGESDEKELILRFTRERRVDALVLMKLSLTDEFLEDLSAFELPLVLLDRPSRHANFLSVSMENVEGAHAAMTHLISAHGYERIAVITGPTGSFDADQRLIGCRKAAADLSTKLPDGLELPGDFTEESGRLAVERFIESGAPLPHAIFALNDPMAVGALEALTDHGLRVPDDVALVGFDDFRAARHLALTTVHVPMQEMGRAAARAALASMQGTDSQVSHILHTELVVRRSCGCERE